MNFGTLKSRLSAQIGRDPNPVCYDLVTADVNQGLRVHQMVSEVTLTEAETVDLPDDFLAVVSIYRDTDPRTVFQAVTRDALHRTHQPSGLPCRYVVEDDQIRFSPAPSGSESIVMRYYAKVSDLVNENDTNTVLTNYPAVYVYGALAHHAALTSDDNGLQTWFDAYKMAVRQAQAGSNKYLAPATPIRVTPGAVA